jgi:hypothetical protein
MRKFIDEMKLYQNAQQKYKSDIKKKVKRQVQIVQPDATEEDIDAILHSEGGREALYKEKILAGRVADPIKYVLENPYMVPYTYIKPNHSCKINNNSSFSFVLYLLFLFVEMPMLL